ncbi:MAG: hypothetical protein LBE13_01090 [Bacteroidales bacterium]|jgi:hypothetical protein|nr:hypothetical protein [Bacteroidales bacterium]
MKKVSKKSLKKVLAFIGGTAFIALCVYNVSLGLSDYGKRSTSLFTLEALADGEGGSSENHCPNQYDVPHHYIKVVSTLNLQMTSNSKGEISFTYGNKVTIKGGYAKNSSIWVIVNIYNCDGIQTGSCCKQSDVRAEIF